MNKNKLPDLDKIFLNEEDETSFLPGVPGGLASIFGNPTHKTPDTENTQHQSLSTKQVTNVAPTQEYKTEVIIAKAVHAFKLQNGQYISKGKLGIALVGNVSTKSYQIILYRSKQDHISVVSVNPDFSYNVQANNYSTYYDTRKETWSILFENNKECIEFAREICLSKYLSLRGKINSLFYQDLNDPEKGTTAKEGDSVHVKYFINTEIVQPLQNCTAELTMTVEISTDDTWERVLLGMPKNLRRMLILPPSKQISLGPGFPKERDIVLEIEIINIQSEKEIKIPEFNSKAAILSRMAKMGQSILPKTSISTTTDSEEDEVRVTVRHKKSDSSESSPSRKQFQSAQEFAESTSNFQKVGRTKHLLPFTVSNTQQSLVPMIYRTSQSLQPQFVTMDGFNIFLSETRTQNAEIRMGMSKISDNIQKLLDKFHVLELQNASSPNNDKTMENTLKMILSLNASQVEMKNILSAAKVNEKNEDLVAGQPQETTFTKEEDERIVRELENSTTLEVTRLKEEKMDIEKVSLELKERITNLESKLATKEQEFDNLNSVYKETKETVNDYQKKNSSLEEEILQLRSDYKALKHTNSNFNLFQKNEKNKEIKLIMNNTYHTLLEKFSEESYSTSFIKETIASTLRDITLQVLNSEEASNNIEINNENQSIDNSKQKNELSDN